MLNSIFADCGIALVIMPSMSNSYFCGVTFPMLNKIVMVLTPRGKEADRFWFTLFHEIGHVVNGHYKNSNYSEDNEAICDEFARNALIPSKEYDLFISKGVFTFNSINSFASSIDIDPGIVVGRLMKDGYVDYTSELRMLKKEIIL